MAERVDSYFKTGDQLPPEGQTYYGKGWDVYSPQKKFRNLILAEYPEKAEAIMRSQMANALMILPMDVIVDVEELTPEEFVAKGKQLIDSGRRLPDFIAKWGGLMEYQDEVLAKRQKSRQNI